MKNVINIDENLRSQLSKAATHMKTSGDEACQVGESGFILVVKDSKTYNDHLNKYQQLANFEQDGRFYVLFAG